MRWIVETFWHMKIHECAFLMQKLLIFSVTNSIEQALTKKLRNFKHLSFNIVSFSSLTFCFLWQKNSFVTVSQLLICKLTKACSCDENSWTKNRKYFTLRFFKCPVLLKCLVLLQSSLLTHLAPEQHPCIFWSYLLSVSTFSLMSNTFLYQWPQLIYVLYQEHLLCSERDASLFSVITPEQPWKAIPSLHTLKLHCYLCKVAMSHLHRTFYYEWCK